MDIIQEYVPQINIINKNTLGSNYVAGTKTLPSTDGTTTALSNLNNRNDSTTITPTLSNGTVTNTDLSQVTGFITPEKSSTPISQYTLNIAQNLITTNNKIAKQIFGNAVILAIQTTKLPIEQLVQSTSNGVWFSDQVLSILNTAKPQSQYSFKQINNIKITTDSYA